VRERDPGELVLADIAGGSRLGANGAEVSAYCGVAMRVSCRRWLTCRLGEW
jgi:hypothetical protein